ncbi:oligosaccharide flippase family protein [Rhodoplanes sp. TEM]|uniref:Oligosaccharide flippase family protein n=1 Tax=Rhodoplanes tepidamans TaxID=200616 RepID=A0ABT5J5T2_RHOTP|nr:MULTISPECIES: oligosaccharide flippase family protein [Rhodoplanes]MDC7784994.1 oligosaccharide flippase family protein [Rhodoplanes tepidamans]MDC7986685.1 oligosaccharide flippase family protein [Rhodoplanes sp. TEM]MDQ0353775.1 O-antigen/teichoic acid export membrane protein [Rhodoplanes tepidamans]
MASNETDHRGSSVARLPARLVARLMAWRNDDSDRSVAQRSAGAAFLIRVASAGIVFVTQILLARWMGRYEFGIYVAVWAWVSVLGPIGPLGIAYSAQRFIPQYRMREDGAGLRGFLRGSRWLCLAFGTVIGGLLAGGVWLLAGRVPADHVVPFLIAALILPVFTLGSAQDGIARSFDWIDLALVPVYILQPVLILAVMGGLYASGGPMDAVAALATACAAMWLVTLVQAAVMNRRLRRAVPSGPRRYEIGVWLRTALPIFLADSFFLILFYVDMLMLQLYVGPQEIAVYYAASKTLSLVHFVSFAVGAAVAHRFSAYHVAGEREKLESFIGDAVRWTFWPTLAFGAVLVALGKPILMLFGPGFDAGYPLIWIIVTGLVARSAVGPAERLLNMTGQQPLCAAVYAAALVVNVTLCVILIPRLGILGAAWATATAVMVESVLLFTVVKWRLGLHAFVWRPRRRG